MATTGTHNHEINFNKSIPQLFPSPPLIRHFNEEMRYILDAHG